MIKNVAQLFISKLMHLEDRHHDNPIHKLSPHTWKIGQKLKLITGEEEKLEEHTRCWCAEETIQCFAWPSTFFTLQCTKSTPEETTVVSEGTDGWEGL